MVTWKPGWCQPVGTLIQFSITGGDTMWVSFAIWSIFVEDAKSWFVGSADFKNTFHQMRTYRSLQFFFAPKLVTQERRSTRNVLLLIL